MSCGHPSCHAFGDRCESCARRRRYGVIVDAITDGLELDLYEDKLDALAEIMIDRHRLLRAHRRELFDEQREAQRGATEAYHEGAAAVREAERW